MDNSSKVLSNEKKLRFRMSLNGGTPKAHMDLFSFRTRQKGLFWVDCSLELSGRIRTATDDGNEAKFRLRGIEEGKGGLTKNSFLARSDSVRRFHHLLDDSNEISELRSLEPAMLILPGELERKSVKVSWRCCWREPPPLRFRHRYWNRFDGESVSLNHESHDIFE